MEDSATQPERLSPLVRRMRAPNPGPMTLTGTNSYIVGQGPKYLVIDPGPAIDSHVRGLAEAVNQAGGQIKLILVTHGHPDHYPGALDLSRLVDAPVAAHSSAAFPHAIDLQD